MLDGVTTFAGLPVRSEEHPSGAVFRLSKAPRLNLDVTLDPVAKVVASKDYPYLVVRLADDEARFRDAKDRCLLIAQRLLDMLAVN